MLKKIFIRRIYKSDPSLLLLYYQILVIVNYTSGIKMYRKNNHPQTGGVNGYMQDSAVETENDRLTDELKEKIRRMKVLSIDIGTEVKSQNQLLREMDDDFDNAGGFLGKAMSRVKSLAKGSHNYMILYLFLFSLFVFLLLWLIIKFN